MNIPTRKDVSGVRLLIIAPEQIPVPPVMGGSVEICIQQIAKRLAGDHEVTVVSRQHSRYSNHDRDGKLTFIRVPGGSPGKYIEAALKAVRGMSFDVIQIDNRPKFVAPVKKAFPRTPVSLFLHSLTFVSAPRISRKMVKACLSRSDLVVTNSRATAIRLRELCPGLGNKLRKVWLGVDTDAFRPPNGEERTSARKKYGIDSGFTILFTGRIIPRKGIPVLLKSAGLLKKKVPSVKVVIAGRGKQGYVRSLKRKAALAGVDVRFIGYIPHRRIHQIYRLADCFVCPSQGHESFGLVNVEAMASGLPVVASRNGGIKEIVDHGKNGLLVNDYRSPGAFAFRLTRIALDSEWAERLSRQARFDAVNRFSWEATVRKLSRIYERLISS